MKSAADFLDDFSALPAYSIRRSKRARRVGLRVLPGQGLEVVLPLRADASCVPDILRRYSSWIRRALERMPTGAASDPALEDGSPGAVPSSFFLKGGEEEIAISTNFAAISPLMPSRGLATENENAGEGAGASVLPAGLGASLTSPPHVRHIRLKGKPSFAELREWVREEARGSLGIQLSHLAHEHGFTYSDMHIRFQRTRWGSCSAKGSINLNGCLVFLPNRLTRYILLHELCHTRQLNHSERYWKILFSVEPEALALDKAMRRAWRDVPPWIFSRV